MTSDNTYILTDVIFVTNGATLSIQEGTIIRGEPKSASAYDPGTLVIARDGQIDAEGSPANPIIHEYFKTIDNFYLSGFGNARTCHNENSSRFVSFSNFWFLLHLI